MSTIITPSPKGKGAATNDADSIMPLLFATIGNPSISFPKMAAMDAEGRSASALEHKFRKWRQKGREIAEANPDHAGEMGKAATPKKRAPAAKKNANANGKTKAKQADVGDEEDKTVDYAEAVDITKEEEGMAGDERPPPATNGNKKRAASKDTDAGDEEHGASAKKAKMTKKGTATVVKKKGAKARESFESIGDEEDEAETPAKAKPKAKPVAKGRGKAAKEAGEPVSKWRAVAMAQEGKIALKDDEEDLQDGLMGENGLNGEGEEEDIKVEMQFEQEFV